MEGPPKLWFIKAPEVVGVDPPLEVPTALAQAVPSSGCPKSVLKLPFALASPSKNPFTRPEKETNALAKRVTEFQHWKGNQVV